MCHSPQCNFFSTVFKFAGQLDVNCVSCSGLCVGRLPEPKTIVMKPVIKRLIGFFFSLLILSVTIQESRAQYAGLDTLQLKTIFEEPFLAGVRPNPLRFSPDGQHFYFSWNDSSYASKMGTYRVDLEGRNVEAVSNDPLLRSVASPDNAKIAYTQRNDLIVASLDGSDERTVFSGTSPVRNTTWSAGSDKIAFVYGNDVWVANLTDGRVSQLTNLDDGEPSYSIRHWAHNDGKLVLFQNDTSDYREVFFPRYVPEFVEPGGSRRGQPNITVTVFDIEKRSGKVVLEGDYYLLNSDVSVNGRFLAADYTDHPMKMRRIVQYDMEDDSSRLLHSETTEGWIYSPMLNLNYAPEGDVLMFTSEDNGWGHIYTVRADGSRLSRLTSGNYEVVWVQWIDANNLVFASTERDSGLRDLYTVNANTFAVNRLTRTDAYRLNFRLSPDKRFVTYSRTFWNQPSDIYILDIRRPRNEVRLTNSIPERFELIEWQTPQYIHFTSRDEETSLTMDVLKPHDFDPGNKYPVVVFVHGAGSLQNVFQGWSTSYHREYMFHQYLNKHGYVVVEVDYRHSTGYGRKFREDVTNWMGKYELEDIIDGLEYLNRQYGYLDMEHVGVYGGSYGGFMALYALSNAPEYFAAGAALRAVTNWVNYFHANPGYTRPRLGDPVEDKEHYDRSSPITYADSLSRPAIILHGLIDDNVGFQDAAQYIDRLIMSGNTNFEMMMYPSERHAYTHPNSWYDQYLRIFEFFEKHLKN